MANDRFTFEGHFHLEDDELKKALEDAKKRVASLSEELDQANQKLGFFQDKFEETAAELERLESATGVDRMKEQLKQFREAAEQATYEFRAFLETVKLNDAQGTNDYQFSELFDKISQGALTANQAILSVKTEFAHLIEENFNQTGGDASVQIIREFSAALERMSGVCDTILEKLQNFEVNGIQATGSAVGAGAAEIVAALNEIQAAAGATTGDVQGAYEPMVHLFEAMSQYASIDDNKLWRVSEAFKNIGLIGQGRFGTGAVDNILRLVAQLNAMGGGQTNFSFNAKGFNELNIRKQSYENLATYLPIIASVDTGKLEALSKIDFSNLTNLKVDKASLEAIAQMAQALSSAGGAAGQAEKQKSDFADAKSSMQEYYRLLMQVERARSRTLSITGDKDSGFDTDGNAETAYRELVNQLNAAKDAMDGFREGQEGVNLSKEEYVKLSAIQAEYEAKHARELPIIEERGKAAYANLADKVNTYVEQHRYAASRSAEATQALDELQRMANSGDWRGFDELKKKLAEVQNLINSNNLSTETWFQKMKKTFGTRARSLLAGLTLGKLTQSIRDIYKYVLEIDTAMTNLKIVTKESDSALQRYAETAKKAAVSIGASVSDIIKSTTTYARLGFSLDEAGKLGELTTAYSKVGDVSVDDATKNITGIVKAYQVSGDSLEGVIDKLIYVGRRFAISSAEIGEGMNNAASSLAANGNTMDQAMGILTAANTTVQNISRASTATRTIAARLSASKQELEELGETVEADTVVKLSKAFKAYGIEIQDGNGELKSTYEILNMIASKWEELDDAQRSAIAGLAAGTRQQDVFYSIIQNWNDAKRVVSEVDTSSGELAKATEDRLNSIQGRIDVLKAKLESISQKILSSTLVKTFVDVLGGVISALDSFLSLGDGIVGKIVALTTVTLLLNAAVLKINLGWKALIVTGKAYIATQLKMNAAQAAAVTGAQAFGGVLLKQISSGLLGVITIIPRFIAALITWAATAKKTTVATHTLKGAMDALSVNPVMLIITAIVAAGVALHAIATSGSRNLQKISEEAKATADSLREIAKQAKEDEAELDNMIERYQELAPKVKTDADARKEVVKVQKEINKLVGAQSEKLDLVNGNISEQNKLLMQRRAILAQENAEKYKSAFLSSYTSANLAYESERSDMNSVQNWFGGMFSGVRHDIEISGTDDKAREILDKLDGITAKNAFNMGTTLRIDFDADGASGAFETIEQIDKAMKALEDDPEYYHYDSRVYLKLSQLRKQYAEYVDAANESRDQFISGLVTMFGYQQQIQEDFSVKSIEEFNALRDKLSKLVSSYESVSLAVSAGAISQENINDAIDEFLLANYPQYFDKAQSATKGLSVSLKSTYAIIEEVQGGFDGICKAMKSTTADGYLTIEMLSELSKLESANALAGLRLADILEEDARGFKLTENALQTYIDKTIEAYTVQGQFASQASKENAEANLQNLARALSMLTVAQGDETDSLSSQKKALQEQLKVYKQLIDLRKKMLQQYRDELNYKKELEEKERRISQLQTQLAISRLDTSASGRAKSRELSNELQSAQEELDDFTLEHAIEVVTNNLDEQYEEYESYINEKLDGLETTIESLGISKDDVDGWIKKITDAISDIKLTAVVSNSQTGGSGGQESGGSDKTKSLPANYLAPSEYSVSKLSDGLSMGKDDITVKIGGKSYDSKVEFSEVNSKTKQALLNLFGGFMMGNGTLAVYDDKIYIVKKGQWRALTEGKTNDLKEAYKKALNARNNPESHHSGGFVGGVAGLKSSEVFAKLLKGEFVATPQMMKRFMTSTLPELAYSGASGGSNEFNAPLINIQCDNVTQESLPGLKEIVNDAVKEIKKQLDGGLGRAGYRKPANQIV